MGLKSVTTEQGVSVTPYSSFILDWAMHTTGGMGESVVASSILNQTASYLAHSVVKSCTLIMIYTEFTADQYNYIIIVVLCMSRVPQCTSALLTGVCRSRVTVN